MSTPGYHIITLLLGTVAQWLIYTALLWGMIKVQRMNCNLLALFASSLVATLINMIPVVGCYLSWVVLVICLWKCTKADIAPDILFTVGVAGAIMFCLNLWVIGALMGDLRPDFSTSAKAGRGDKHSRAEQESTLNNWRSQAIRAKNALLTNAAPTQTVKDESLKLSLKGVSLNPQQRMAIIKAGSTTHTVALGEWLIVKSAKSETRLLCEEITESWVVVAPVAGEKIKLAFR